MNLKNIIVYLLTIFPFVAQTAWLKIFSIGGVDFNPVDLHGITILFFVVLDYLLYLRDRSRKVFYGKLILFYIGYLLVIGFISIQTRDHSYVYVAELLLRLIAPYFFYLYFYIYLSDKIFRLKLYKKIWYSTLIASTSTIAFFFLGIGFEDVSQDVGRYAGFFGDSMSLAFISVISTMIGSLFYDNVKENYRRQRFYRNLLIITYLSTAAILMITVTKMMIVVTFLFITLWFGIYKKKHNLIPVTLVIIVLIFVFSEDVQKRFKGEIGAINQMQVSYSSIEDARGFGSGRFGRWVGAYDIYMEEFSDIEKIFGRFVFLKVHNQYFGFLLLSGVVGLTIFLVLIFKLLKTLWRYYKRYRSNDIFMAFVFLSIIIVIGFGHMSFTYTYSLWLAFIMVSQINIFKNIQLSPRYVNK